MFHLMKIRSFLLSGFISTLVMIFMLIFIFDMDPSENNSIFLIVLVYWFLGVFPFFWFLTQFKKQRIKISTVLQTSNIIKQFPLILILIVTLIIFSLGANWLMNYSFSFVFPNYVEKSLLEEIPFPTTTTQIILLAMNICFIGPISEEFIFRGLLLKRLGSKTNILAAAIIANFLFGFCHSDIIGSLVFGVILSILYLKTGNLLIPIVLHILHNTVILVLSIYIPSPDFVNLTTIADLHHKMIPNILLLAVSIPVIWGYISRNKSVLFKKRVE